MSHLGFNRRSISEVTPASTSRVTRSPVESGVYDNYSTRVVQALPSFWREDDDEQVTRIRSPQAEAGPGTVLPTQPLLGRRTLWQVALQLRGDELSRLWRRNAIHLAGRIYVWSDHARQWVQLHSSPEALQDNPRTELPAPAVGPNPAHRGSAVGRRTLPQPVDLTRHARRQLISPRITRGWVVGVAASVMAIAAAAVWWPEQRNSAAAQSVQPSVEQSRPPTVHEPVAPSSPVQPVPVESLPLVTSSVRTTEANASSSRAGGVDGRGVSPSSGGGTFSPETARRALARAAGRAGRCSSGVVSGSVLVTYEPSGAISDVSLGTLAGDTSSSACIVNAFRSARIAPFHGNRVVVKKSFSSHT